MRTSILFILSFCCFFWQAPLKHIETNSRIRVSGIADGGSTTRYTVQMVARKSSDKIEFSSFSIGTDTMAFQVYKKLDALSFTEKYEKGDTIYLSASHFNAHQMPKEDLAELGCRANISYKYKDKRKHLCIEEIKTLPTEHMP